MLRIPFGAVYLGTSAFGDVCFGNVWRAQPESPKRSMPNDPRGIAAPPLVECKSGNQTQDVQELSLHVLWDVCLLHPCCHGHFGDSHKRGQT